ACNDLLNFFERQRFRQYFPLLGKWNIQSRIAFDATVEQQETIEMPDGREFSRHRASVHCIREQLLDEPAYVVFTSIQQRALSAIEKGRELANVSRVGRNRERTQSFFDLQIVDERRDDTGVGLRRHTSSMRIS